MKTKSFLIFAIPVLLGISCKEKVFTGNVDCDKCYTDSPAEADLAIDLSVNNKYPRVPVMVFRGDVEDNNVVLIDTADSSPYYVTVAVEERYSVKAEYKKDSTVLYVVDGTKLKVKLVSDACDQECYVIEGEKMDARIKSDLSGF
jgi:hypothetical protein